MSTPTFPELQPKAEKTLADALAALGRGSFTPSDLVPLSDLGRREAAALAAAWPSLPEATRVAAVRSMDELAEDLIELSFGRALRIALSDESPVVRQLAVAALWEDEAPDLPETLLELLESDPSADVRAEAAAELGRFAERAALGQLEEEPAARVREALLRLAADTRQTYVLRRRSLESVASFGADPQIRELIRAAYQADDPGLRAGALRAMGRSLDLRWLDAVLDEFDSPDAEMRYEAARASGELADDRAVPGLARLATDRDAEVRFAAVSALGRIGGRSALRVLEGLAQSARPTDRAVIADALDEARGLLDEA